MYTTKGDVESFILPVIARRVRMAMDEMSMDPYPYEHPACYVHHVGKIIDMTNEDLEMWREEDGVD